jgi:hypothetical protein
MSNTNEWRQWFAWRPVRVYAQILGMQTSLEPWPPGHRGRVAWLKWIERRRISWCVWEYRFPQREHSDWDIPPRPPSRT